MYASPVNKVRSAASKKRSMKEAAPPPSGKEFYLDASVLKNVKGAMEQQHLNNMSSGTSFPPANNDAAY